jgi:hypothetical protein
MGLPTIAIQTAAISRYRADTPLQGLLGGSSPIYNIFDENGALTNTPFPYLVIYPIRAKSGKALTFELDAVDSIFYVCVYTQTGASGGMAKARAIAKRVYDITHKKPFDLSASGFSNFFLLFQSEEVALTADGITQEITVEFHLMTQG